MVVFVVIRCCFFVVFFMFLFFFFFTFLRSLFPFFFFLNDTAPPEIYPLPLHAALPIPDVDGRDQDVARRARLANRAKQRLLVELPEAGPGALGKERTAAAQPADPHPAAVRAYESLTRRRITAGTECEETRARRGRECRGKAARTEIVHVVIGQVRDGHPRLSQGSGGFGRCREQRGTAGVLPQRPLGVREGGSRGLSQRRDIAQQRVVAELGGRASDLSGEPGVADRAHADRATDRRPLVEHDRRHIGWELGQERSSRYDPVPGAGIDERKRGRHEFSRSRASRSSVLAVASKSTFCSSTTPGTRRKTCR